MKFVIKNTNHSFVGKLKAAIPMIMLYFAYFGKNLFLVIKIPENKLQIMNKVLFGSIKNIFKIFSPVIVLFQKWKIGKTVTQDFFLWGLICCKRLTEIAI